MVLSQSWIPLLHDSTGSNKIRPRKRTKMNTDCQSVHQKKNQEENIVVVVVVVVSHDHPADHHHQQQQQATLAPPSPPTNPAPWRTRTRTTTTISMFFQTTTRKKKIKKTSAPSTANPKAPEAPCVGFYVFWYKIRSFFAIGIYIRSEISHRKINQECMGP